MLRDNDNNLPADHLPGANFPPEPIEPAQVPEDKRISDLVANADEWAIAHQVIEDEETADAAANWLRQLSRHIEEFEAKFKAEKAPHEKKLAEVRNKFRPWLDSLDACLKSIRPRHRAWLKLDDARKKADAAAAARAAEEEQRRADQLAEQAKAGGPNAVSREILAREVAQQAEERRKAAAAMPTRAQARPSLGGPTLSLHTVWKAHIADQDKYYKHVRHDQDVKALLQSKANAAARRGTRNPNLPGCEIFSTQE